MSAATLPAPLANKRPMNFARGETASRIRSRQTGLWGHASKITGPVARSSRTFSDDEHHNPTQPASFGSRRGLDGGLDPANPDDLHDEIVEKALEIIWDCPDRAPLNVSEVAKQLPVTRRTLDRRFAANVGRSVLEEINLCRISRAKRLLAETDLLVKTISYLSGFPSRERMRLLFLREEGLAPSEYREFVKDSNHEN